MPPDAEKLRQRKATTPLAEGQTSNGDDAAEVLKTLPKLGSTEVAIDGNVYDITSFNHPGGDQILLFGGNDVTIQYKMIHPYHTPKHLEKMKKVGKVVDYTSE